MGSYLFSPGKTSFYPKTLIEQYRDAGSLPDDLVEVSDEIVLEFSNTPQGKIRISGVDGLPAWGDAPEQALEERAATVAFQRKTAYRNESDPIKLEAEYDAIVAGSAPDYTAWLSKVEEIKQRFPFPES